MDMHCVKMWYLHHSGFAVETAGHFLVFDYSCDIPEGEVRSLESGVIAPDQLNKDKKIFVFVSHAHGDHFNDVIFDWQKEKIDINYILSYEIKDLLSSKNSKRDYCHYLYCCSETKPYDGNATYQQNFYFVLPYKELYVGSVNIKAYGSTDVGVSFLVKADGFSIFHAGDLNCWYWYYESTPEELKQDKESFEREVEKIEGEDIDIAFFPVDPRLKEYYYKGGEYFIKAVKPRLFVPMHFWGHYDVTHRFAEKMKDLATEVATLSHRGQRLIYKK